jgi:hypothetical protein
VAKNIRDPIPIAIGTIGIVAKRFKRFKNSKIQGFKDSKIQKIRDRLRGKRIQKKFIRAFVAEKIQEFKDSKIQKIQKFKDLVVRYQ